MAQQNSTGNLSTAAITGISTYAEPGIKALVTAGSALNTGITGWNLAVANNINAETYVSDDNGQYIVTNDSTAISCAVIAEFEKLIGTEVINWATNYPHLWAAMTGTPLQTA